MIYVKLLDEKFQMSTPAHLFPSAFRAGLIILFEVFSVPVFVRFRLNLAGDVNIYNEAVFRTKIVLVVLNQNPSKV
jgi:hypothetical protein